MRPLYALLLCFALLFIPRLLPAADVVLEWDDDNPQGSVAKYGAYIKGLASPIAPGPDGFVQHGFATIKQYELQNLPAGTYTVYVTAVTPDGLSSGPSDALTFTVPSRPGRLRIKVTLMSSQNLHDWFPVATYYDTEDAKGARFYRAEIARN